jgi:quercetin dioxygenase-like cupin family protein
MKKHIISIITFWFVTLGLFAQYQQGVKVEKLLQTDTTVIGQKISYPNFANAEVTMCKVSIPPGEQTGWHKHEIPVFAYVMQGTLTVELEDGSKTTYAKNATISEVFNTFHNGVNNGNEEVVLIAVYLGAKGVPLSVKK